jgi:predicted amidohydrolase YtcJ
MPRIAVVALAGVFAIGGCAPAPSAAPASGPAATIEPSASHVAGAGVDLLLRGANVLPLDFDAPLAEAVAIDGDRIEAVGSNDELAGLAGPATRIIDLAGRTVVPGFIDAHEHRIVNGPDALGFTAGDIVQAALEQGYTTIDELYSDPSWIDTFTDLDDAGALPLRVNVYLAVNENSAEGASFGEWFNAYEPGQQLRPHVRVAGLKVFTDFDNAQILLWDQAELDAFVLARYREGWPLALKTVSVPSLDMILESVAAAATADPSVDVRGTRLEHMLFATAEQTATIAELGLIPAINLNIPGQVVGLEEIDALIARQPAGTYVRYRDLFDAGIEPAGISGFPTSYVDEPTGQPFGSPLHMIWQAVTRAGNLGQQSPSALLDQAITAEEGLRALTINAAVASGEGDTKGTIEPGKLADLVVLSADPLQVDVPAINEIEPLISIVGGEIAWCAPDVTDLCEGIPSGGPTTKPAAPSPSGPAPGSSAAAAMVTTASRSLPDQLPELAFDGNPDTAWVSGADAEQWIQVELPEAVSIRTVAALVTQDPPGATRHQLWVGASENEIQLADTHSGATQEGDEITFGVPAAVGEVRIIRIVTTASPSWVAWREIELTPAT